MASTALERAITVCGGSTALASAIGVAPSLPSMWKLRRKVPAEHCPAIEQLTRTKGGAVLCEELRPDVPWSVLRRHGQSSE
ncbi:transcriptional regulator [Eleftheria terrae]|uniref:transcriptional regulator n=1 Tax=Eleftheria terrae TaxID=1597781 RepID=UPI003438503B